MSNDPTERRIVDVAHIGAGGIFLFLAILLALARLPVEDFIPPPIHILAATLLSAVAVRRLEGPGSHYTALSTVVGFLAIIALWAFATQTLYEVGQDGHSYHLAAIWSMAEGWNPLYDAPHKNIWVDSYPNGYWALEAYVVSATGLLLSGKSLNIGLMAAVMLLAFGFFENRLQGKFPRYSAVASLILAAIVVANPVVLTQIMTHYVDGPLYLLGTGLLFFLLSDTFAPRHLNRWAAAACIILMVNTKTAALYYAPLITIGVIIASLLLRKPGETLFQNIWGQVTRKALPCAAAFIIGIAVIGYKPYLTNVIDHGAFLYPPVDEIMDTNVPENLETLAGPEKFLYGIFSRTEDSVWPVLVTAPINLKIPGSVRISEFKDLDFDTRRGGFGPLFSLAFLLAFVAYGAAKVTARDETSDDGRTRDMFAATGGFLIVISAAFPEPWWARYIPFVWPGVLFLALAALYHPLGVRPGTLARALLAVVILCFLGNIAAGLIGSLRQSWNTYQRTVAIAEMRHYPVVELFPIEDPRETSDYQSDIISSSEMVWLRLLRAEGIDAVIISDFDKESCALSGFFDGNILWCVRGEPEG